MKLKFKRTNSEQ